MKTVLLIDEKGYWWMPKELLPPEKELRRRVKLLNKLVKKQWAEFKKGLNNDE